MWSLRAVPSLFLRSTLLCLLVAPAAFAAPVSPHLRKTMAKVEPPAARAHPGRSVGSPTEGHLIGGAHLAESPYLRILPADQAGDARWGLEPLVAMVDRAARSVQKQFPDAVLSVGHLSRPGGGEIDHHASHESGRDADVAFYVKNQQGKSIFADHMVPFKPDGTAPTWPGAQFDDAKNWAFISSIAAEAQARVTYIFVESKIRERLLQYATKIGAPPAIRSRAAELMAQPRGSLPHDDHFHVRIACPAGSDKCIELPAKRKSGPASFASAHTKPTPSHAATHASAHVPAHTAPAPKEEKEASVPSLAPMVPGLDAAIIGAPLTFPPPPASMLKPLPSFAPPPFVAPLPPIDDPDGVLEQ